MNSSKVNHVVAPITATVPDVVSLLKKLYESILFHTYKEGGSHLFAFTWNEQLYILIELPWGCVNSPTLYHNMFHLHIPQSIELAQYIKDIMFIRLNRQEVTSMLENFIRCMHSRVEDKPYEDSET